jgi:hypothetical protein
MVKPGPIDTIVALPAVTRTAAHGTGLRNRPERRPHLPALVPDVIDCTTPQLAHAASDGLICAKAGTGAAAAKANNAMRIARAISREAGEGRTSR